MKWFLFCMSLIWISIGSGYILYTAQIRNNLSLFIKRVDRRVFSVIAIIIGVLFIASAAQTRNSWFIITLGIIAVVKGAILSLVPQKIYDKLIGWYTGTASEQTLRFFGIIALVIGTAVLSWIL